MKHDLSPPEREMRRDQTRSLWLVGIAAVACVAVVCAIAYFMGVI